MEKLMIKIRENERLWDGRRQEDVSCRKKSREKSDVRNRSWSAKKQIHDKK